MSKKPTLEDIDDDIDNMDMDIAEFDPSLRTPIAPLRPEPTVTRSQDSGVGFGFPNIPMPPGPSQSSGARNPEVVNPNSFTQAERESLQKFQIIYPCYFDVQRSHKQGRRVSEKNAVFNPLAKTISDACRQLRLPVLLELEKTHPQDFGNPGRVRVLIKDASDGNKVVDSRFQNKRVLLNTIAKYLKEHPTTLESVSTKSSVALPPDYEGFEPEEIPQVKGYKMNTLVPVHSKYNLKHPMTKSIYDPEPEEAHKPIAPKVPKKKVMKIRG